MGDMLTPEELYDRLTRDVGRSLAFDRGREFERANPTYSHRNGETTPPEIRGRDIYYWVDLDGELFIKESLGINGLLGYFNENLPKFYGPIQQPKR